MHYKNLLKGYCTNVIVQQPSETKETKPTYFRNEEDIRGILDYFDHIEKTYFPNIPYSRNIAKAFLWNIPDKLYNYMTKLILIDPPITCQPLTCMYGHCLADMDSYPNFIRALIEYDVQNEDELADYINKNSQILEEEESEEQGDD